MQSAIMRSAHNLDLCERYATPEPDSIWFDWGADQAVWVYACRAVVWHGEVFYADDFAEVVDWIADRIREDRP